MLRQEVTEGSSRGCPGYREGGRGDGGGREGEGGRGREGEGGRGREGEGGRGREGEGGRGRECQCEHH